MNSHQYPREADYKIIHTKLIPRCARADGRARLFHALSITAFLVLFLAATSALADSATWARFPQSGNWGFPGNWSPATVPNGPNDTATFVTSNASNVSLLAATEVNGIVFNSGIFGASAFTISSNPGAKLTISGVGITNNSGLTQTFATEENPDLSSGIIFSNSATAGTSASTRFINSGSTSGTAETFAGFIEFLGSSTAGSATFVNNGGDRMNSRGGSTQFFESSSAGSATLIANGGTNNGDGGFIVFADDSTGGASRIELFGNGLLDMFLQHAPGVTVGSIEGNGTVFLGANNLTVGSNNKNTTFSGVIGGLGGSGGSLTKIGSGRLTLTRANTYPGGTVINGGTLFVNNARGSGTGTGPVQVNTGTLAGIGHIQGAVTLGTRAPSGAALFAGTGIKVATPGTLTIGNTVRFHPGSTCKCVLNRTSGQISQLSANGVTIDPGVPFTFVDTGTGKLPVGTVFTVINNTSAAPIAGTFSNLSDGLILMGNGTNLLVSYEGGNGNDLTLTVVP